MYNDSPNSRDKNKFQILHIGSDKEIRDAEILKAAVFVCRNARDNATELLEILGLTESLKALRQAKAK
jgi:hypothetical protein